jgi:hypothetical protein
VTGIAPGTIASFDKYAIGEDVVAGNAMSRRAQYGFGSLLDLNRGDAQLRYRHRRRIGTHRLLHFSHRRDHQDRDQA